MIKLKHSGKVWKKVIKQKYPGAVSNGARANKESYKEKNKSKRNKREKTEGDISYHYFPLYVVLPELT